VPRRTSEDGDSYGHRYSPAWVAGAVHGAFLALLASGDASMTTDPRVVGPFAVVGALYASEFVTGPTSGRGWGSPRARTAIHTANAAVLLVVGLAFVVTSDANMPWRDPGYTAAGVVTVAGGVVLLVTGNERAREVAAAVREHLPRVPIPLVVPVAVAVGAMFVPVEPVARLAVEIVVSNPLVSAAVLVGVQMVRAVGTERTERFALVVETAGVLAVATGFYEGLAVCLPVATEGFAVSYDLADNVLTYGSCRLQPSRGPIGLGTVLLLAAPAALALRSGEGGTADPENS
jgi:zinc transporter ZupT